jgi:phosphoserine phosphatase
MGVELYLIRHGESEINKLCSPKDVFLGRNTWSELTAKGVGQAKDLGRALGWEEFDRIIASSTVRTQQTARYSIKEAGCDWPKIEIALELAEIDQGDLEGKAKSPVMTPALRRTIPRYWEFVPPGGKESQKDMYDRAHSWIEKELLPYDPLKAAVYTHEGVIKALLVGLFGVDEDAIFRKRVGNCEYVVLNHDGGKWSATKSSVDGLIEMLG